MDDAQEDDAPTVLELIELKLGVELFDYQREFFTSVMQQPDYHRELLFYKTGAGKSLTALAGMVVLGHDHCTVVAPPSTHQAWEQLGAKLGIVVTTMSHAKFRMKSTKLSRHDPLIADEFHLFGGQKGQGWRKLSALAQHLMAPLFMLSATPNYNDAERCYCAAKILDRLSYRGGYLEFIYQNCSTEQNPFGMEPKVLGFLHHKDAAAFLSSLPGVYYLPDDLVYSIDEVPYSQGLGHELLLYNYDGRRHRIVASIIELAHTIRLHGLVGEDGFVRPVIMSKLVRLLQDATSPVLVYSNHSTIAEALAQTLHMKRRPCALVTGNTSKTEKDKILLEFRQGLHPVLIGTATLATGTDGLDRVCDTLVILDDTDDDALRRQLIGRIMPRGDYVSIGAKQVFRFVPA